jgi:hypothetical protein
MGGVLSQPEVSTQAMCPHGQSALRPQRNAMPWDRLDAAAYAAELAPKYPDICDADVGYERYAAHVHSLANMRREHTSTHPRAVVPQHVSSRG